MSSSYNKDIAQLTIKIEVQRTNINELISELIKTKVDYEVQISSKDLELALLREKCKQFQHRVEKQEDNTSRNVQLKYVQQVDTLMEENKLLKKKNNEMFDKIKDLESKLARKFNHCSMASFSYENECSNITSEIKDSVKGKNNTSFCDKLNDLGVLKSTEHNKEPVITVVVDSDVQKDAETNKIQRAQTSNESTSTFRDNIGFMSMKKINPIDYEVESNTSTKDSCCQAFTKSIDDNTLKNVNKQKHAIMVNSTVNDQKKQQTDSEIDTYLKLEPICALQELCMSRKWMLPKYEFFKEGGSKTFTYTVVCTVKMLTVEVNGMIKREAKKKAATLMYHKVKSYTSSNIQLEKNVSKDKLTGNGILSGLNEEPAISTVVNASVLTMDNDKTAAKENKVSILNTSIDPKIQKSKVLIADIPKSNKIHGPPISKSVIVNDDKNTLNFTENDSLSDLLRLSNNSGVRQLKEINAISMNTIPSSIDLLERIINEEKLTINYEICETCTFTIRKDFSAIQITIRPYALTIVGFGETIFEAQENAAHECLTRFKTMMDE